MASEKFQQAQKRRQVEKTARRRARVAADHAALPPQKTLDTVIREIHEKNTVLIAKVHNLQVDVGELRKELATTHTALHAANQLMLRILDDPEARHLAEAVHKDFFITRPESR